MTKLLSFTFFISLSALFFFSLVLASPTTKESASDVLTGIENSKVAINTLSNAEAAVKISSNDDISNEHNRPSVVRDVAEEKDDTDDDDDDGDVVPVQETSRVKTGYISTSDKTGDTLDKTLKTVPMPIKHQIFADLDNAKSANPKLSPTSRYACFSFLVFSRTYTQRFRVSTTLWHVRYTPFAGYNFRCRGKVTYSGRIITVRSFCATRIYYFRA